MKQLKFLVVAFTLLMGISLTSCMGDSDPTVTWASFMKVVETYPYTFQDASGIKFIATNTTDLVTETVKMKYGDIVYMQYSYNSEEQNVTADTKEIKAKMQFYYNASDENMSVVEEGTGAGEPYENATVTGMYSSQENGMAYFDKNTLLLCIKYMAKKDLSEHSFTLVYDTTVSEDAEEGVMNLYLRHSNNEDKPDQNVEGYFRAFDISDFLNLYGEMPTKIRIWVNETNKSGSNSLDDAKEELQSYDVNYKSIFDK